MRNTIIIKGCNQNECVVTGRNVLLGVEIECSSWSQVYPGSWDIVAIYDFKHFVALGSTKVGTSSELLTNSICESLEGLTGVVTSFLC